MKLMTLLKEKRDEFWYPMEMPCWQRGKIAAFFPDKATWKIACNMPWHHCCLRMSRLKVEHCRLSSMGVRGWWCVVICAAVLGKLQTGMDSGAGKVPQYCRTHLVTTNITWALPPSLQHAFNTPPLWQDLAQSSSTHVPLYSEHYQAWLVVHECVL